MVNLGLRKHIILLKISQHLLIEQQYIVVSLSPWVLPLGAVCGVYLLPISESYSYTCCMW